MTKPINVFSMFDGMSCGQLALQKAGIPVGTYHASEIDKWAIQITKKNFPFTFDMGDVTKLEDWRLKLIRDEVGIDLVIGGSPCQGFSFAGNQLNFDDPRSKLFFDFVRVLKILKPKYFLLENVRMKKESQDIISEYMGVEPVAINSNLVSAQNRHRLYWTNIPFSIPHDKGIVLADILEDGVTDREKSHCLDANYFKGGNLKSYFEKHRRQLVFNNKGGAIRGRYDKDGKIKQQLELRPDDKTNSLTTVQKDNVVVRVPELKSAFGACIQVGEADIKGHDILKRVYSPKGKSPTLTAHAGKGTVPKIINKCIQVGEADLKGHDIIKRVYSPKGKAPTLTTMGGGHREPKVIVDELTWRKLTPLECERLQTVPDGYTEGVSNTQRYKMLGNGWTVDVVAHILKGIRHKEESEKINWSYNADGVAL